MTFSLARFHNDWPRLLDPTGAFLTLPVLKRAFPDGLEPANKDQVAELRAELDLVRDDPGLRPRFIRWVLSDLLRYAPVLREGQAIPLHLSHTVPEHGVTLRPDFVVLDPVVQQPTARVLVVTWPDGTDLTGRVAGERWNASPMDRLALLLRATRVGLGIVTDGTRWMLISTVTPATSTALWDVDIWSEERVTLDAFVTLLGARRLFSVAEPNRLEALLTDSIGAEEEITGQLGLQVRQAVELLVNALSRADRENHGRLLAEVRDEDVYGAAVTVMMRLVFLLYSEERRLFPIDDDLYASSYALSTLLAELDEEAQREGEDPLDRSSSAWGRLLALSRALFGGIQHEDLRLPAYGGSLFDPDRYPFLEGRPTAATPLPEALPIQVTDLEVLDILKALQILRFRVGGVIEARRLSYRNLDVESIGHVYEGLLDHGAMRVEDVHLGLEGKNSPEISLVDLERRYQAGDDSFQAWVVETAGMTAKQVVKALSAVPTELSLKQLRAACDGDALTVARVVPFLGLVRPGARGLPTVFLPGSIYVTHSSGRHSSGTYYTPRALAEEMVQHALEPLVYLPGPQHSDDRSQWRLRSAAEILEVKVCDMTMGSGAFLVAACRFLADRLIESSAAGPDGQSGMHESEDAVADARRLVVEHCLYGVDRNPMAVEMAKLSMWLVTLAKDRPFTFLDAKLRPGDALLGLTSLEQLETFHLDIGRGREVHGGRLFNDIAWLRPLLTEARSRREQLESIQVLTVRDAQDKARLHAEYQQFVHEASVIADIIVGAAVSTASRGPAALDDQLVAAAEAIHAALSQAGTGRRADEFSELHRRAQWWLNDGRPDAAPERRTVHWCLEFPEVFDRPTVGFDAMVGNPPFLAGWRISGTLGSDYRDYLTHHLVGTGLDQADLVAVFFRRAEPLLGSTGSVALVATKTIAQGASSIVGITPLLASGLTIARAWKSVPWPGRAALEVAKVWLFRSPWVGTRWLDGKVASGISASLAIPLRVDERPRPLPDNANVCFEGVKIGGAGFLLSQEEADALISIDPRYREVIYRYLTGEDVTSRPDHSPTAWVINFHDWDLDKAEEYPECLAIVRERVKPMRETSNREAYRLRWWRYHETRPGLHRAIKNLAHVLVISCVGKAMLPVLVPNDHTVFSNRVDVFAVADDFHFGVLSSSVHWWWALTFGGRLENRPLYLPSRCFDTFPFPPENDPVTGAARALRTARANIMSSMGLGLTAVYNRMNDANCQSDDAIAMRELHRDLDVGVATAYGWSDLELAHGFYEAEQGARYTISNGARDDVISRLHELNLARASRGSVAGGRASRKPTQCKPDAASATDQSVLPGVDVAAVLP